MMIMIMLLLLMMMMMMLMMMKMKTHGSGGLRATLQLADPRVEEPAEYELARGPFEYGGTSAPHGTNCFVNLCVSVRLGSCRTEQGSERFRVQIFRVPLCPEASDASQSAETLDNKSVSMDSMGSFWSFWILGH
jgi:hypothetical protein